MNSNMVSYLLVPKGGSEAQNSFVPLRSYILTVCNLFATPKQKSFRFLGSSNIFGREYRPESLEGTSDLFPKTIGLYRFFVFAFFSRFDFKTLLLTELSIFIFLESFTSLTY